MDSEVSFFFLIQSESTRCDSDRRYTASLRANTDSPETSQLLANCPSPLKFEQYAKTIIPKEKERYWARKLSHLRKRWLTWNCRFLETSESLIFPLRSRKITPIGTQMSKTSKGHAFAAEQIRSPERDRKRHSIFGIDVLSDEPSDDVGIHVNMIVWKPVVCPSFPLFVWPTTRETPAKPTSEHSGSSDSYLLSLANC